MKVLFVVAVFVFVLQDVYGNPMLGGMGALPPLQVRSAEFVNKLGSPVTVVVTFESSKKESRLVAAGKSVNVEGIVDHGTWTATDPIKSFKVISSSNDDKQVSVSASGGVERHQYEIGVGAANGQIKITKTVVA